MIAVIADDITGAAEVAGIARRFGLRVCLSTAESLGYRVPACDVYVVATDTRSMSEAEAAAESRRVGETVAAMPGVKHIFKKTDSALRGHVVAELKALLDVTPYTSALYIPANPSKGRTISDGTYYIDDKPLHLTDFAFDPEFPAFSSQIADRLPGFRQAGITFADVTNIGDIEKAMLSAAPDTLLAGAADLFTAYLRHNVAQVSECKPSEVSLDMDDIVVVCGSTQSRPEVTGLPVSYMPRDVYDGGAADDWFAEACAQYDRTHALAVAISHTHRTGHEAAAYLREVMARLTARLTSVHVPACLVIDGGATAYAVISALGWDSLDVDTEIAPGVICMRASSDSRVIMKPGSYPWGPLFPV